MKLTNKQKEDIKSLLGEGFHTAFRKAVDGHQSAKIHDLITEMPNLEWANVIDFVGDHLIDYLKTIRPSRTR